MKKFFYKFLVVTLALGMLTPSWITKLWVPISAMASVPVITAGPSYGNSVADDSLIGTRSWSGVTNIAATDSVYASFTSPGPGPETSHYLRDTSFGFSIPSGTTINGIEVNVVRTTTSTSVKDDTVRLVKNGTITGSNYASASVTGYTACVSPVTGANCWTTSAATATYGGPTDLWGSSWEYSDINNLLSGLVFSASRTYGTGSRTVSVDSISMKVYYSDSEGPKIVSNTATPTTTGDQATISVSVSDNIGPVSYTGISINGSEYNLMNPVGGSDYNYYYVLPLDSLNPVTYQIKVVDAAGNITISDPISVIQPVDNDAPVIDSITGNTANIGESTTITVNATDNIGPVSAKICFDGGAWENMVGSTSPFTYAKSIPASTTPITYYVKVFDAADNWIQSEEQTIVITDTRPVFSAQSVQNITSTTANITWTTDHASTSRVVYDTASHLAVGLAPNYGYAYSTVENASLVINHSVTITGLTPGVIYYFRTISHGSPEAVGSETSFKTLNAPVVTTAVSTVAPTVVSEPATPQVTTPAITTPAPTEQGQIKGTETTETSESEKINWTPWIILFILIILAGAATGGYFYWFGKDDEEEIISAEVLEKNKKPVKKDSVKEKPSAKKSKRW